MSFVFFFIFEEIASKASFSVFFAYYIAAITVSVVSAECRVTYEKGCQAKNLHL